MDDGVPSEFTDAPSTNMQSYVVPLFFRVVWLWIFPCCPMTSMAFGAQRIIAMPITIISTTRSRKRSIRVMGFCMPLIIAKATGAAFGTHRMPMRSLSVSHGLS